MTSDVLLLCSSFSNTRCWMRLQFGEMLCFCRRCQWTPVQQLGTASVALAPDDGETVLLEEDKTHLSTEEKGKTGPSENCKCFVGLVHGVAELVQLGCSGRAALSLLCPSLNVLTPQRAGTEEGVDVLACGWQHALMPAWL
ncbi:hypothetical protein Anapl_04060 [Anas platyrhynchos]|uniref:Uncharacterized protein n=1 Tax=Anas platyrhynchos TaxID=8839 RepID=R0LSV1_ANAPL|nr:hypothetical protein Anapl_04060 [Anas platyrhynchos]